LVEGGEAYKMSGRQIHRGVAFVALRMGGATGFPPLLRDQLSSREAHHRPRGSCSQTITSDGMCQIFYQKLGYELAELKMHRQASSSNGAVCGYYERRDS
jgi:hypothetical protein